VTEDLKNIDMTYAIGQERLLMTGHYAEAVSPNVLLEHAEGVGLRSKESNVVVRFT